MKILKKIIVVAVIFTTISLTSCTDSAEENLNENKIQLIDKDDIEEPNDRDKD